MRNTVFISYAHQDKPVADAVCARLEQSGIRCWIAPRDIQPGRVGGGVCGGRAAGRTLPWPKAAAAVR